MTEVITSTSNAKIKHLVALSEKSSLRREEGVFVLEGRREIERAIAKGYEVVSLFLCPEILRSLHSLQNDGWKILRHSDAKPEGRSEESRDSSLAPLTQNDGRDILDNEEAPRNFSEKSFRHSDAISRGSFRHSDAISRGSFRHSDAKPEGRSEESRDSSLAPLTQNDEKKILRSLHSLQNDGTPRRRDWPKNLPTTPAQYFVAPNVYSKIAYRGSTEGVIAIVKEKHLTLNDLKLGKNPLVVVLESVEKPGNLGAVLRSADAVGIDALIVCDPLVDGYNPNVLRASTGAIFSVPTVFCTNAEAISFLKEKGINIFTAQLQDSSLYYDCDFTAPTAIVFGTESTGLTEQWRKAADRHIRIPMNGIADSLNVSVSAAILMFEALRQRSL